MTYKTKEIKSRGTLMDSTNQSSHGSAERIQRSGFQSETAPFSSTITPQSGSIAARLAEFPSDLVEQTRASIRSESRIQREAIERNIEALDAAQQASRQEAARRNGRIGGQVYSLQRVQKNRWTRLLEEEHKEIATASEAFPPTITPTILRTCTKEYYQILETGSKRDLCASCGSLFEKASLCEVATDEPHISTKLSSLDSCGIKNGSVSLCNECDMSLRRNRVSKFSILEFVVRSVYVI